MSTISPLVQNGLLAQLVADSSGTRAQLDKLTQQAASGQVADTYGGLGATAHVSIDLRPQMAQVAAWQQNIAVATTPLATTQSVLGQLGVIASSFTADGLGVAMQSTAGATAVAAQAQVALGQVTALLNTQAGGQYIFGGVNSTTPPIDNGARLTFTGAVGAQVGGLNGTTDIAALIGNITTLAAGSDFASGNVPLTRAVPAAVQVGIGIGQSVPVAIVAGTNTYAQQAGANTTGSYVRDLIGALSALAGLGSTQAGEATLQSFGVGIAQVLQGVSGALSSEEAGFGQVQSNLTAQGNALSDTLAGLTRQVSGVEDVDMAATATAVSQVQTQLQASYKLIAGLPNLSLVAFL